jgi:hypothetical protein
MTVRVSMESLIEKVRRNLGMHSTYRALVSDQEVQDALDRYRMEFRTSPLRPQEAITSSGAVEWKIWTAPYEDWEDTVLLQTGNAWATLTPTSSDLLTGRWTFAAHQTSLVYATGFSYDTAAASADLARDVANTMWMHYNFGGQGATFNREAIRDNLLEVEQAFRAQARPLVVGMFRTDAGPDGG